MERTLQDAERFAKGYSPGEDDHPDLESRVVMYRRAVDGGNKRVIAAHARTLVRFARNVGALEAEAPRRAGGEDGPTRDELRAEAQRLGLPVSGSKADLQARIDAHNADAE